VGGGRRVTLVLAGFGTALPEYRFTQEELAELHSGVCRVDAHRERTLRALYRRAGVKTRASVVLEAAEGPPHLRQSFYPPARDENDRGPTTSERMGVYAEAAPPLALDAARRALEAAGVPARSVSHLITVSCTGFAAPGVDARLIEGLGLPPTTERTHVGFMGCHGSLNALRVARSCVAANREHVPLVCSVELCTLHFAYGWDPDMVVANALFADGAAAVVGRAPSGPEDEWRLAGTGTCLLPDSRGDMTWRIGDHGFRMTLSAQVPDRVESHLKPWIAGWLRGHGLTVEDVASWAVHPGGPRILTAVEKALELPLDALDVSRRVLAECGNMSSPTVLFVLDRLREQRAPGPTVALAFGPGLVAEAALFE